VLQSMTWQFMEIKLTASAEERWKWLLCLGYTLHCTFGLDSTFVGDHVLTS
jgi:hypothetical protein